MRFGLRLRLTTISAELTLVYSPTGTGPASSRTLRRRLLRIDLVWPIATLRRIAAGTTGITTLRLVSHLLIDSVHHISTLSAGHAHAHEAHHSSGLISGSSLHSSTGCTGHIGCTSIRVAESLRLKILLRKVFKSIGSIERVALFCKNTGFKRILPKKRPFCAQIVSFYSLPRISSELSP